MELLRETVFQWLGGGQRKPLLALTAFFECLQLRIARISQQHVSRWRILSSYCLSLGGGIFWHPLVGTPSCIIIPVLLDFFLFPFLPKCISQRFSELC